MKAIQINVSPTVLKYLQVKFGKNVVLNQKSNNGKFLFNLLKTTAADKRYDTHLPEYSQVITVQATKDQIFGRGHRNVNSRVFYEFNRYMENEIREEFHALCDVVRSIHDWTMNECIDKFFQIYGFEESDYQHDTLKRSYTRYTEAREELQTAAA